MIILYIYIIGLPNSIYILPKKSGTDIFGEQEQIFTLPLSAATIISIVKRKKYLLKTKTIK